MHNAVSAAMCSVLKPLAQTLGSIAIFAASRYVGIVIKDAEKSEKMKVRVIGFFAKIVQKARNDDYCKTITSNASWSENY